MGGDDCSGRGGADRQPVPESVLFRIRLEVGGGNGGLLGETRGGQATHPGISFVSYQIAWAKKTVTFRCRVVCKSLSQAMSECLDLDSPRLS